VPSNSNEVMHRTCCVDEFHFLERSSNQLVSDLTLLQSVQSCMKAISKAMEKHNGQLRQFIIDDKGTVCIGTWGLRRSVSSDCAAMAVTAARDIIRDLHTLGISSSIGITSGKVYCGLVGSPSRHEYAVMGPSVNLSARLMGKASGGQILCDGEIRSRDRTHFFEPFRKIDAKGYAKQVATFKPVFRDDSKAFDVTAAVSSSKALWQQNVDSNKEGTSPNSKVSTLLQLRSAMIAINLMQRAKQKKGLLDGSTAIRRLKARVRSTKILLEQEESKSSRRPRKSQQRLSGIRASQLFANGSKQIFGRTSEMKEILKQISLTTGNGLLMPGGTVNKFDKLLNDIANFDLPSGESAILKYSVDDTMSDKELSFFEFSNMISNLIIVCGPNGIGK
jgi:class 3 adenylate cyclase